MTLASFETLFDILENPVHIIHYIERRSELESHVNYLADELDLIGFYIDTLFNLDGLPVSNNLVQLTGHSRPLDIYYDSKAQGIILEKPKPKLTPLWNNLLEQLKNRSTRRWVELGSYLLRVSPKDQFKIRKQLEKLKTIVHNNWHIEGHKNFLIYTPPKDSYLSVVFILMKNENFHMRYNFMDLASKLALEGDHVQKCIAIAINIDNPNMTYHLIGLSEKADSEDYFHP